MLFIAFSAVVCLVAIYISDRLARELERKEKHLVSLWSSALNKTSSSPMRDYRGDLEQLIEEVLVGSDDIPRIVTDKKLDTIGTVNVPERILSNPIRLNRTIKNMANKNSPIEVKLYNGMYIDHRYIFYGSSSTTILLRFFPIVSLVIILVFVLFSYITFDSTRTDEQNKVWIGMAKETAHQLGTPTSSLLGWIEYLRSQEVDTMAVDEMSKDIDRLLTVVDRFSKIGSESSLTPQNIITIVSNTVNYFNSRLPKKVTMTLKIPAEQELLANSNQVLYGWVIENLLRNSIDALSGEGNISIKVYQEKNWIITDVTDTGKGIAPANIEKIFKPGFTTKSRGWGLGLSLCARIINNYHKGRIFVAASEPNKGTTIRVMIHILGAEEGLYSRIRYRISRTLKRS